MSAGAAPAVAVIKALRAQDRYPVEIGTADAAPRSVGRLLADWFEIVPSAAAPSFVSELLALCARRKVEYVFPVIDEELPVWARARERFAEAGVTVLVHSPGCVDAANDKQQTDARCRAENIPAPHCYDAAAARALPDSAFPLFGKPRFGRGSIGAQRIESRHELDSFLMRHPDGIVQELLAGTELTVDVLCNTDGKLLAAVPKERLEVKSGMATKSRTRALPELWPLAERICKAFGVTGVANLQLMGDAGNWKLVEVNTKFATSLPLTVAAGVNLPLHMLELARGDFDRTTPMTFTPDLLMLRCWEEHFLQESKL